MIDIRNTSKERFTFFSRGSKLSVRLHVNESALGIQENWNDTM